MPVPPPPTTYICNKCDWKRTVFLASDVRMEGINSFHRCPSCGSIELTRRRANLLELLAARIGLGRT